MKRFFAVALVIAIMVSLSACIKWVYPDQREMLERLNASAFMPELDSIGIYKNKEMLYVTNGGLFPNECLRLIVDYEETEFVAEIERLETAYTYLDEPQLSDDCYEMPVTAFSAAGFDFRVVELADTDYPKYFGMVGISDEKLQIAYLWFYSQDLDYICKVGEDQNAKMIEFVNKNFEVDKW